MKLIGQIVEIVFRSDMAWLGAVPVAISAVAASGENFGGDLAFANWKKASGPERNSVYFRSPSSSG